jgi:thiamine biosynthesis lipoprotein
MVQLDLGGIAKGYALDRAALILHRRNIRNALINIGGNVMALGSKGKTSWSVGIQHPRASGPIATLALYDGEAIGTSGDYQRFFEVAGRRYSHLIDPTTGEPAQHTQAVTVLITPQKDAGLLSDVTSKPIFLGAGNWREMARRCGVTHVMRIDASGRISVTSSLRARLKWQNGSRPDEVIE